MSFRTTTFPLDRQGQGHLYIYVVYIVCLSLRQTRIFIEFVPHGHSRIFIEFVRVRDRDKKSTLSLRDRDKLSTLSLSF